MQSDIFPDRDAVISIIKLELQLHPLARPVDIYKLLIQAAFGPGHLITDLQQATQSILSEMDDIAICTPEPYQSLEAGFGYIRYHLCNLLPYKAQAASLLQEKAQQLASSMMQSCCANSTNADFATLWSLYHPLLSDYIQAPTEEWKHVQLLAANNSIPSHSPTYKAAYQPHYRVIQKRFIP